MPVPYPNDKSREGVHSSLGQGGKALNQALVGGAAQDEDRTLVRVQCKTEDRRSGAWMMRGQTWAGGKEMEERKGMCDRLDPSNSQLEEERCKRGGEGKHRF